jgi:hypothetical protein
MSTSARANFRSTPGVLAPVRVILSRSIITYRPHPPHSQAHPDFAAVRLIRDALAVLVRLGDPRVVPCFYCLFLLDMPSSTTPGSPSVSHAQSLDRRRWPSPSLDGSALPNTPSSASDGTVISWFPGSLSATAFATACRVVRPLGGSDRIFLPATQGFYFRAFDGAVTLPAAGYSYGGNWASSTGGTFTRWNSS